MNRNTDFSIGLGFLRWYFSIVILGRRLFWTYSYGFFASLYIRMPSMLLSL